MDEEKLVLNSNHRHRAVQSAIATRCNQTRLPCFAVNFERQASGRHSGSCRRSGRVLRGRRLPEADIVIIALRHIVLLQALQTEKPLPLARHGNIIFNSNSDVAKFFRDLATVADVDPRLNRRNHSTFENAPFITHLVIADVVHIHPDPMPGSVHVKGLIGSVFYQTRQ